MKEGRKTKEAQVTLNREKDIFFNKLFDIFVVFIATIKEYLQDSVMLKIPICSGDSSNLTYSNVHHSVIERFLS